MQPQPSSQADLREHRLAPTVCSGSLRRPRLHLRRDGPPSHADVHAVLYLAALERDVLAFAALGVYAIALKQLRAVTPRLATSRLASLHPASPRCITPRLATSRLASDLERRCALWLRVPMAWYAHTGICG